MIEANDRFSYKEKNAEGLATLSFSTQPLCYKDDDEYKLIELDFKDSDSMFTNTTNCLKTAIQDGSSEDNRVELATDEGFVVTISFEAMKYGNGEIIHYPYKRNTFITTTRDNKPILIQKGTSSPLVDEYEIDRGRFKKSIILESALPSPTEPCNIVKIVHRLTTNIDAEVVCDNEEKHSDFVTVSMIEFRPKNDSELSIFIQKPEMFDANYNYMPIYYEFRFIDENMYELSYVFYSQSLKEQDVKFPITIDPTANVSRSTTGTTWVTFDTERHQNLSYTYNLYGWNDGASKNTVYNYTSFIIQDKANKEIYRKDSGTNSRETGSGSVNTSGFSLGLNRIGITVTRSGYDGSGTVTYLESPKLTWPNLDSKSVGSVIHAADFNEAKDNIARVINAIPATWQWSSNFPVGSGTVISISHLTHLRSAVDFADNSVLPCTYCSDHAYYVNDSNASSNLGDDSDNGDRSNNSSFDRDCYMG